MGRMLSSVSLNPKTIEEEVCVCVRAHVYVVIIVFTIMVLVVVVGKCATAIVQAWHEETF